MSELRIGVIGIGNMGSAHVRNIVAGKIDRLKVTAISDNNAGRKELFPDIPFHDNPDSLIESPDVDAVLVATPHFDHTILGKKVFAAGKHLLMEKPISVHKADCEELIAAHKDKSLIFSAMFNQRTDPRYTKLKELIDSGQLGEIRRVVWIITDWFRAESYYSSGGWRATWRGEGGGVLVNQCPHQLDLWQWLFGMPDQIRAFCDIGRYHDIEVEDDVTCYMEYASGRKGVFITTTGESPGTNRLEITAENGRVIIDKAVDGISWDRNEVPMSEWNKTTDAGFSKPGTWEIKIPSEGAGPQHIGIIKNFTEAILDGSPLLAPGEEGIYSVELANAMLLSSHKEATLKMPMDAKEYADLLEERIRGSRYKKKTSPSTISSDFDNA